MRSTDVTLLHPAFRVPLADLLDALAREKIPLQLYEGWRSPERQAELYARGRVKGVGSGKVTRARAWRSLHQFGVACDCVFWWGGWTWTEPEKGQWERYHELARERGLEPLSFERPHVQLATASLADMVAGNYTPGWDDGWEANLEAAIERWGASPRKDRYGIEHPGAPPLVGERPVLAELPEGYVYDEATGVCRPA